MAETPRNSYEKPLEGLSLKEQISFLKNEVEKMWIKLEASDEKYRLVVEKSNQTIADLRWTVWFYKDIVSQILSMTPEWEQKSSIITEIKNRISIQNQVRDRVDEIVLW